MSVQANSQKLILVTAADTAYFNLLQEWVKSLTAFPEIADLERCVLDIGLDAGQCEWLTAHGTRTLKPSWDIELTPGAQIPKYYQAMTARPFLPKYFPGYEIIMWLDADIWVQTASYLLNYITGAEKYGLALSAEIDRSYAILFGEYNEFRLMHHSFYYSCFGRQIADQLIQYPIINSGAFAARRDHAVWARWQFTCRTTMQRAILKHSEQAALNLALYEGGLIRQTHLLPSLANWLCPMSTPLWDPTRKKLVEPNLPHEVLGLVHLAGLVRQVQLRTTRGGQVTTALTYSGIQALAATAQVE
jgi:hypothetical protein